LDFGAKATTISSTGNHGASAAAYACRAGLDCFIFTVPFTSQNMITLMSVYGAKLVAVPTFEDRWKLMKEGVRRYGWCPMGSYTIPPTGNPYGVEGYKTLSFEVIEQLGWKVPDFFIVPTAFAEGLYGSWKGFQEFRNLGLTDSLPRMVAACPAGCDPLQHALNRKTDKIPILEKAKTVALSIGTFTTGHQGLVAVRESRGIAASLADEEILNAQRLLALDGIFAEPASATSVAAAIQMGRAGNIDRKATVVCVITASGLKMVDEARKYLPEIPLVEPDFDSYRQAIAETYDLKLD
jgi:threonine synthase